MNRLSLRITKTERAIRSRRRMRRGDARASRRKKPATLFLAGLVALAASGAVFTDRAAPSDRAIPADPAAEHAESGKRPDPIPAPQDGAEIYLTRCMSCHQVNGGGVPGVFPPLAGTEWVTGSEEVLIRIILNGMTGEIEVNGMAYTGAMPPWGEFLNDEDMAALLTYIRAEWGNDAEAIAPETVAQVRKTVADRAEPWTVEELEAMREAEAEAADAKDGEKLEAEDASGAEKPEAETETETAGTEEAEAEAAEAADDAEAKTENAEDAEKAEAETAEQG